MIKISALKFKLKLSFTGIKHLHEIPTGSPPPLRGDKYRWGIKISRFSTNKSLYLADDTR